MKKLLLVSCLLAWLGAGCSGPPPSPTTLYENPTYGFSFRYPANLEAKDRAPAIQPQKYLGLDTKFFLSVRDLKREDKPVSLAFFYALPKITVEEFTQALAASGTAQEVKSTAAVVFGGIPMTKVVNATELGLDKTHYLFDRGDQTIILSVFIGEEKNFEPLLASFK